VAAVLLKQGFRGGGLSRAHRIEHKQVRHETAEWSSSCWIGVAPCRSGLLGIKFEPGYPQPGRLPPARPDAQDQQAAIRAQALAGSREPSSRLTPASSCRKSTFGDHCFIRVPFRQAQNKQRRAWKALGNLADLPALRQPAPGLAPVRIKACSEPDRPRSPGRTPAAASLPCKPRGGEPPPPPRQSEPPRPGSFANPVVALSCQHSAPRRP